MSRVSSGSSVEDASSVDVGPAYMPTSTHAADGGFSAGWESELVGMLGAKYTPSGVAAAPSAAGYESSSDYESYITSGGDASAAGPV